MKKAVTIDKLIKKYFAQQPLDKKDKSAVLHEVIRRDSATWQDIYLHGCSDPFWPDGLNLNLTRNHILAAVKELDSFGEDTTQIYIPPQVADGLMIAAGKHFEKRYERLKVSHKLVVEGEEISLF